MQRAAGDQVMRDEIAKKRAAGDQVMRDGIKKKSVTNIDLVNVCGSPDVIKTGILQYCSKKLRSDFNDLGCDGESVKINEHKTVAAAIKAVAPDSVILFPVTNLNLKNSDILPTLRDFFTSIRSPVLLVVPTNGWDLVQKVYPATIDVDVLAFTKQLKSPVKRYDSFSLGKVILDFATENKARNLLKEKLQAYVTEVESHKDAQGNTSYRYNLSLFFADHQAHNRQANYKLAKELLEKLTNFPHSNIATVFADLDKQKEEVMKRMPSSWSRPYFSTAIRGHLAEIRVIAEEYIKKSGEQADQIVETPNQSIQAVR